MAEVAGSRGLAVHWFRKGLRVHDNPSLLSAFLGARGQLPQHCCVPVFCLDPFFLRPERVSANRLRFLLQSLSDLDASLRVRGSQLVVLHGDPREELPRVLRAWGAETLYFEADHEPYAIARDAAVEERATAMRVSVHRSRPNWLCDPDALLAACPNGEQPRSFGSLVNAVYAVEAAHPELGPVVAETLPRGQLVSPMPPAVVAENQGVPEFSAFSRYGYREEDATTSIIGGESEALRRLQQAVSSRPVWSATFDKPSSSPTLQLDEASTTTLSPFVKFGCLSVRTMLAAVRAACTAAQDEVREQCLTATAAPTSLEAQLLWREFYYLCAANTPNFDRMERNPLCRQIAWRGTREFVAEENGEEKAQETKEEEAQEPEEEEDQQEDQEINEKKDNKANAVASLEQRDPVAGALLSAWEDGRTGYPWIDACMRQLRQEGWIHHLSRHAVACFLTRGDLWISWEEGQQVFDRLLLDADWALNAGNWQWLSCSRFFHQFGRVYNPATFPKKYDTAARFVRHYVPEVARLPEKYVFEPWKAPRNVQAASGCVIGQDYPARVVRHEDASQTNKKRMARAFAEHRDQQSSNKSGEGGARAKQRKRSEPDIRTFLSAASNHGKRSRKAK